jgi:integrase
MGMDEFRRTGNASSAVRRSRAKERLTALQVGRIFNDAGGVSRVAHDGGGLYFVVVGGGASANWQFKYMHEGKSRTLGLGPYPVVGLSDARRKAAAARKSLKDDRVDPLVLRDGERAARRAAAAKATTFRQAAEAYIRSHRDGWRNAKHAEQWSSTLKTYVYPTLGDLPVSDIDVDLVMRVLEQEVDVEGGRSRARLWIAKSETASRLRGRIEAVLGWAAARGLRTGDNPAVWKGRLQHQLPARSKVRRVEHHAALPYQAIPAFIRTLKAQQGTAARALELAVLTATRTSEVLNATWREIDLAAKAWAIPADRMKGGRDHRVPLSPQVLEVLAAVRPAEAELDDLVFPGAKPGRPLSNMAMLMVLRRMGHGNLTAHGFRSTFRDWGAEQTTYPGEVLEMALAHSVGNRVEAAYRRGDLFDRRRALMDAWATWCDGPGDDPRA